MKYTPMAARLSAVAAGIFAACLFFSFTYSQNAVKARWNAYVVRTSEGQADIHFTAEIPGGWRMYSQNMVGHDGPLATNIEFDPDPKYDVIGAPKEIGKTVNYYQDDLGMEVSCLEGQAQYIQHITFKEGNPFAIKCMVNYMLCRDGEMLPPDDEDFTITVQP